MNDQPTCGKGLAARSVLPAKLGELIDALAENLEVHQKSLDQKDGHAKQEYDAYVKLAREHRTIANLLTESAGRMAGYRDLPMGRHDERVLAGPQVASAFAKFVKLEAELLALLQEAVERDRKMLAGMRSQGGGGSE